MEHGWWLPFLLAVIVSIGVTFTIDKQVGFGRVVENVIADSPKQEEQMQNLTAEERAVRMQTMSKGYKYVSYATPVIILLISAIGALINLASFNFGLGAKTMFAQMFCVWMYASLPRLLTGLLTIVTLIFGSSAESSIEKAVGTNLTYSTPDAAPWLKTALSFLM